MSEILQRNMLKSKDTLKFCKNNVWSNLIVMPSSGNYFSQIFADKSFSQTKVLADLRRQKSSQIYAEEIIAMLENDISYTIRGLAFKIHAKIGPELLESNYKAALGYKLNKSGLSFDTHPFQLFRFE